jgi:hypothetical protein
MKRGRMKALLEELRKKKEMSVTEFLSYIAVKYGIRRTTGQEYLRDWLDGGYITIERDIVRFVKTDEEETPATIPQ